MPVQFSRLLVALLFFGITAPLSAEYTKEDYEAKRASIEGYFENPDSFDQDLDKYRYSTGTKVKKSIQILLPIGIGAALAASMGPQAAIPITIGTISAIFTLSDVLKKRSVRRLMQGAFYHLQGQVTTLSKKQINRVKKFHRFFEKHKERLSSGVFSGLELSQQRDAFSVHLLRLNRFGWAVAHRFNSDKNLREVNRPQNKFLRIFVSNKTSDKGNFTRSFLSRNLITLIELDQRGFLNDIQPEFLY